MQTYTNFKIAHWHKPSAIKGKTESIIYSENFRDNSYHAAFKLNKV